MPDEAFRSQLQGEVEAWWRDGIVNAGTARRILARYGLAPGEGERGAAERGRLSSVIAIMGAVLVGLGAILFVASNWQQMDRVARLALLAGALLAAYIASAVARRDHPHVAAALVLAGTGIFGASVFLVGQMYHIRVEEPTLMLFWAAGALPMAYATTSRPSLLVGLASGLAWYGLVLADAGAWQGPHGLVAVAYLAWGVGLVGAARIQETFAPTRLFVLATRSVGLAVTLLVLFVLSFADMWRSAGSALTVLPDWVALTVAALFGLAAAIGAVVVWGTGWSRPAVAEVGGLMLVAVALDALILLHPFATPEPYALIVNVVAAATVLWAVLLGITTGRESFVNAGLILFGALVVARYFDFAWALFDRSLVFIGAGLLLLGGGLALERSRRLLLARARRAEVADGG